MESNNSKKDKSFFSNFSQILNRLRSQLLDLTARNRLVNFKYTRRSLRFANTSIDNAYKSLEDDKKLKLQYIPLPPEEEDYPSSKEYATHLGLSTVYELQESTKSIEELQTLLYPKDLERTTRIIRGENRLAIDESGNHILFLAAGFLSYTITQGSRNSEYLAPLLFKPVQIERGNVDPVSGLYTYYLKSLDSDESIQDNVTLREKLNHELGFQLPIYKEGLNPSQYLQIIKEACSGRKGWKVNSHLSLVLLSFKSLALWADLDQQKDDSIIQNPLIKKLFGEEEEKEDDSSNPEGIAKEYSIDEHPLAEIPLIYDADSSQHSALIDALEGKNLVIIGPPGTGKSQTITNLIALAMSRGKSVLFVSEKMAALEVVAKKIERAGLGEFCLELHSNKSNKKIVLHSIEKRLNQTFQSTKNTINEDMRSLRDMRKKLNNYAGLINQTIDIPGDLTIHDILWKLNRACQSLENNVEAIRHINFLNALSWGNEEIGSRRQILSDLSLHYSQLHLKPINHPLQGIILNSLSPISKFQIKQMLQDGFEAISNFLSTYKNLPDEIKQNLISPELNLSWQEILKNLQPSSTMNEELLKRIEKTLSECSSNEIREALTVLQALKIDFIESDKLITITNRQLIEKFPLVPSQIEDIPISKLNALTQNFASALSQIRTITSSSSLEQLQKLVFCLQSEKQSQFKTLTLDKIILLSEKLSKLLNSYKFNSSKEEDYKPLNNSEIEQTLEKTEKLNSQLTSGLIPLLQLQEDLKFKNENSLDFSLLKLYNELIDLSPKMFYAIRSSHNNFKIKQSIKEIIMEAANLIEEQGELSNYFRFDSLPMTNVLVNYLTKLTKPSLWSFFSRQAYVYTKACKNLFKQLPSKKLFLEKLNQLLNWCQKKDAFLSCSSKKIFFEKCFILGSIEQEDLENLINWQNNTDSLLLKKSQHHVIDFFSLTNKTLNILSENKEKILELIQVQINFQKYLSILNPYHQKIINLYELAKPLIATSSISFNSLIDTYECLTSCCYEINMLGKTIDLSANCSDLETLLKTTLNEIEPILHICQSLAPVSMTARQIKASIQAIKRIDEKSIHIHANKILNYSAISFDKANDEQKLLEKSLILALNINESKLPSSFKKILLVDPNKSAYLYKVLQKQFFCMKKWKEVIDTNEETYALDPSLWFFINDETKNLNEIESLKTRFKTALENFESIDDWFIYQKNREKGMSLNLASLIHKLEEGIIIPNLLIHAFDYIYYNTCIGHVYSKFPDLAMINGYSLDNIRHQFSELDRKIISLNGTKLATNIAQREIPKGRRSAKASNLTELALLKHEIEKTRRHIPIRKLMLQAGNAIQALKPCFLMSPLSVAQYLPKSALTFDILIIDEASQLRLPESFSAILRSKQIVVVGDPKQAPSF